MPAQKVVSLKKHQVKQLPSPLQELAKILEEKMIELENSYEAYQTALEDLLSDREIGERVYNQLRVNSDECLEDAKKKIQQAHDSKTESEFHHVTGILETSIIWLNNPFTRPD